jgi:integrase
MEQSVKSVFQMYLDRSVLAPNTVALKSRAFKFLCEVIGDRAITEIDYTDAEDYRNWLMKTRSPQSAKIYISNLAPFFAWSVLRKLIKRNPFDELKLAPIVAKKHKIYEEAEVARILRVANARWKVIVCLGLLSMRRSEIVNLTVSDIDFAASLVHIKPKKSTAETWEWRIKDNTERYIPLPEVMIIDGMEIKLHQLMFGLIEKLPQCQPYLCIRPETYKHLNHRRVTENLEWIQIQHLCANFSRSFIALLKRAQVTPKRFHDLRGTFATKMIDRGMKLTDVQRLMGHSTPALTAKYVSVDERRLLSEAREICKKFYVSKVP